MDSFPDSCGILWSRKKKKKIKKEVLKDFKENASIWVWQNETLLYILCLYILCLGKKLFNYHIKSNYLNTKKSELKETDSDSDGKFTLSQEGWTCNKSFQLSGSGNQKSEVGVMNVQEGGGILKKKKPRDFLFSPVCVHLWFTLQTCMHPIISKQLKDK